jgi:hypothetical protein
MNSAITNTIRNFTTTALHVRGWRPDQLPVPSEAANVLIQLATSILNLQNLPVAEISLEQRAQLCKRLKPICEQGQNSTFFFYKVMQQAAEAIPPGRQAENIRQIGNLAGELMAKIDQWSAQHFLDEERQWASLSPDEFAANREAYLIFANEYVKPLFSTNPLPMTEIRALFAKFPELRHRYEVSARMMKVNSEMARARIAVGCGCSSAALSLVVREQDFEFIDSLCNDLEQNPLQLQATLLRAGGLVLRNAMSRAVGMRYGGESTEEIKILSRLILMYKTHGLTVPPKTESSQGNLLTMVNAPGFEALTIEILQLMSPDAIRQELCVNYTGYGCLISTLFSSAISEALALSQPSQALRLFHQWEEISQLGSSIEFQYLREPLGNTTLMLRNHLLPLMHDPKFLDSLGDALPYLFELDPQQMMGLYRDGSPALKWLQANNWWRDHDLTWFSTAMRREYEQRMTPLHFAAQANAYDFLLALPTDILRSEIARPDINARTPLQYLVTAIRWQNPEAFDRLLAKLGDQARDIAFSRADADGETLLHRLFRQDDAAPYIPILAKYPKQFIKMLLTKNLNRVTPMQRCQVNVVQAILKCLGIPVADRAELLAIAGPSSEPFVAWLQDQWKTPAPSVRLLLLPFLRNHPEELDEALKNHPDVIARWLADEESIQELLSLPQEIWQQLLALRDQKGRTPLEHLAAQGNFLFWDMLQERDFELPLELLCQPEKYGCPLHHAAAAGHVSFLQAVMLKHHDAEFDVHQELLGLRNAHKQTVLQCAESARQDAVVFYLLKEIQLPLLNREVACLAQVLDLRLPTVHPGETLAGLRSECVRLRLTAFKLQSNYFDTLAKQEKEGRQTRTQKLLLPSQKMIVKGAVVPNYFAQSSACTAMIEAPKDVDFAAVLLPLIGQLPFADNLLFADLEPGNEGQRLYSDIKQKLIAFIRNLAANRQILDAYDVELSADFRAHIANILRHVTLYVTHLQEEIADMPEDKAQKALNEYYQIIRRELIGDFGIGLFHCLDGIALHGRQLYDFVMAQQTERSLEEQLQNALQTYRKNVFELRVSQLGGLHEATTQRYYRGLMGARLGLGSEMGTMSNAYTRFAVLGKEGEIQADFDREHTPPKLVSYICGLLNDKKDKTLSKSMVLEWFHQRFSTRENPLCPEQIKDESDQWRPEAVGFFLAMMGIIQPKVPRLSEKRALRITIELGNIEEIRQALANYSASLPKGLLSLARQRGDPEIVKEVMQRSPT